MVFRNKYAKVMNKTEHKTFLIKMIHILFHSKKNYLIIKNRNLNKMETKHKNLKNNNDVFQKENKFYYKNFVNNLLRWQV